MKYKKYESIELVKVSPDVLSRVQFDNTVGNSREGMVNLQTKSGKRKLIVTAPATHAARLTANKGLYQPRRMITDIRSFVDPFSKPVLLQHDDEEDAIGRVIQSTYEPIDHHFLKDAPENFDVKDTFKLIQFLMTTGLLYNDDFPGVGQALLGMEITDELAIEKFLDKRYLTFSIRVASNQILDPHTGLPFRDFFVDDEEEEEEEGRYSPYMPGETVDGMPGFIVLDELKYREVSVVNVPADELAMVTSMEEIIFADSYNPKKKHSFTKTDGSYQIEIISKQKQETGDIEDMGKKKEDKPVEKPEVQEEFSLNKFENITDSSSAEEIYEAISEIIKAKVDEDEAFDGVALSKDEQKKLKGFQFCGPGRSFPVTDAAHVAASSELIDQSKMSESQKQRIKACIKRKAKQLNCDEKDSGVMSIEAFLDNVSELSDFDFTVVLDGVLETSQSRGLEVEDSEVLSSMMDTAGTKSFNKISENKISELESQNASVQEQVDSLTGELKNYVAISSVLMKVFKDNLKISSLEDAVAKEKNEELDSLKKTTKELLKDEKLISKVDAYLGGFAKDEEVVGDAVVEDPTEGAENAKKNISDSSLEKQVRTQFETIKLEDGPPAAEKYLRSMSDSCYVSKEFADGIIAADVDDKE